MRCESQSRVALGGATHFRHRCTSCSYTGTTQGPTKERPSTLATIESRRPPRIRAKAGALAVHLALGENSRLCPFQVCPDLAQIVPVLFAHALKPTARIAKVYRRSTRRSGLHTLSARAGLFAGRARRMTNCERENWFAWGRDTLFCLNVICRPPHTLFASPGH